MPRAYPLEYRRRAIALVKSGRSVAQTAIDLEITQATIYNWIEQDQIDRGERAGRTTTESKELRKRKRAKVIWLAASTFITELVSRWIFGWRVSRTMTVTLVVDALNMESWTKRHLTLD